jgi:hypothetical protein
MYLVLSLVHTLPEEDIFMPKHVGVVSVLLYVYDTVHLLSCNKWISWSEIYGINNFR